MRTKTYKVYKFNELSNEAKENAVSKLYDLNVDGEWWENTYYDAEHTANLQLTSFDIERDCSGNFIDYPEDTAKKIMSEHGKNCDTLLTAREYQANYTRIEEEYTDLKFTTEINALNNEFLKSILEDYRVILQKEYEYLTSEEAIIETIGANDYDFTEDGVID